jgi:hypothetical protein
MSQEFAPENISHTGTQIGERLGRVEVLLQNLSRKFDSLTPDPSFSGDSPESTDEVQLCDDGENSPASVLALFNHVVGSPILPTLLGISLSYTEHSHRLERSIRRGR